MEEVIFKLAGGNIPKGINQNVHCMFHIDTGNDTRLVKSVDQSGDIYVFVESVNRAQIMFPILLIC